MARIVITLPADADIEKILSYLIANAGIGTANKYNAIYEFDAPNETVTVMRVVHGRRSITKKLLRNP